MMPPNFTPQQLRRARREQSESLTVPQQQKTVVSFLGWTFAYTMHTLNSPFKQGKGTEERWQPGERGISGEIW